MILHHCVPVLVALTDGVESPGGFLYHTGAGRVEQSREVPHPTHFYIVVLVMKTRVNKIEA